MKSYLKLFFILAVMVSGSSAWAGMVCSNMAGDGGYAVRIWKDYSLAIVEENNIAGARQVARLSCTAEDNGHASLATWVCGSEEGYKVTLRIGGCVGMAATLQVGDRFLGELLCEPTAEPL